MPFISVRDIQIYYEISGTGADLRNKPNVFDSPLAYQRISEFLQGKLDDR